MIVAHVVKFNLAGGQIVTVVVATLVGGAAAALLSLPTMRPSGHYFARAAFGEVMGVLANACRCHRRAGRHFRAVRPGQLVDAQLHRGRPVSRIRIDLDRGRKNRPHLLWRRTRPLYVDMIVARFHEMTGQWAVLEETEEPSLS